MKTIQDLEREENKISIFCDWEQFTQYIVTIKDLIDAFNTCLTDEQKLEVMTKADYFNRLKQNYIKVNNIEIPTENGTIKGNTLVDPTWNLTASRYGARPHHFCKNYEELRKFECYETDIQKLPGHRRPWETNVEIEEKKENSSGEIVAEEGR